MGTDLFMYMRSEMSLTAIIFIVLAFKIFSNEEKPVFQMALVNILLFANLALGLCGSADATLFNGMYHTNATLVLEKTVLNIGTLLVSLMAFDWLKNHKHLL